MSDEIMKELWFGSAADDEAADKKFLDGVAKGEFTELLKAADAARNEADPFEQVRESLALRPTMHQKSLDTARANLTALGRTSTAARDGESGITFAKGHRNSKTFTIREVASRAGQEQWLAICQQFDIDPDEEYEL